MIDERSLITRIINRFDYSRFKQSYNDVSVKIVLYMKKEEISLLLKVLNDYKKNLDQD